ncbi:alkaline phosphatase [Sandarakinorhabdus rubra]|uniref:alkaline phosphatase n=1 Tax=Sandarakinorhabdus rubra TaxID=2672568 RepID=UPI0013D99CC1|nr:alkaline phosphatase [Sandarakinorhabdus rubra]
MIIRNLFLAGLLAAALPATAAPVLDTPVQDSWWQDGRAALDARLKAVNRPKRAKNVILMVGDGMGIATITAARIFDGQRPIDGRAPGPGEDNSLAWDRMANTALVKTYNTNAQVSDSAGTASALNTGVKTRIGVINFGADQGPEACRTPEKLPRSFAELARAQGMGLGIVTTTRITHATPAAVYGHVPNRDWEGADRAYPASDRASGCADLATQLIGFKGGMDVVLGGGRARFLPLGKGGQRDDGRDLVAEWQKTWPQGRFVSDAKGLRALAAAGTGPVLGLFTPDHLSFEHDRKDDAEPSLPEMARFALAKLEAGARARRGKGYYLMIEGGRIDHGHHASNPYRALKEAQMFSATVAEVLKSVNLDETLVLVTADHSHVMTIAGYPERGNNILGYIKPARGGESEGALSPEGYALDDRGQPMTTLSYANGAFQARGLSRLLPPDDPNYLANKTHGTASESHAGEDVALFAEGPRADLVRGVMEQNLIFHIMAEALGWR